MFICDKCCECCRNLHKSSLYDELHTGDDSIQDNLCLIYENRPLLCRIDDCYEIMFKEKLSYNEYIEFNYKYCNEFKKLRRK